MDPSRPQLPDPLTVLLAVLAALIILAVVAAACIVPR